MNLKTLSIGVIGFSALAIGLIFWLVYGFAGLSVTGQWVSYLPALNASLNFLSTIAIVVGVLAIRRKKKRLHMGAMITAFCFSALFLVSYLTYHAIRGDAHFHGQGIVRVVYFGILISHILATMVALPLVLLTFIVGALGKYDIHRKIARITYPIWLYVSVTGVIVFLMLQ